MAALLRSRIPASVKGKQAEAIHGIHGDSGFPARVNGTTSQGKMTTTSIQKTPSSNQRILQGNTDEGWEMAGSSQSNRHRDTGTELHAIKQLQPTDSRAMGADFFKKKLEGRCYNCFHRTI